MAQLPILYVLPPSHFCERARWALDHAGIAHQERAMAPGVHLPIMRRKAGATSLPILQVGSTFVRGSGEIVDWTGLPGGDPIVETRIETGLALLVRRYVYCATLGTQGSGIEGLLFNGVPTWQSFSGRAMWPVTRRLMMKAYGVRATLLPRLEREISAELDWFESVLGDRYYLVGDQFGRADITAASLLSPLARAPERRLGGQLVWPSDVTAALERWETRPSIRWVRRIYTDHRR